MKYQNLKDFKVPKNFRGRGVVSVQSWWIVQETLFRHSPQFAYGWRRFLLRLFGAKIGKNVVIRPTVKTTYPWKLSIGDYSWVGDNVSLYTLGEIKIGKNVVISQNSYLCTGSHDYSVPSFDIYSQPIVIDDEAWLAYGVFVSPGVSIGKASILSANSTVTSNIPPKMICFGTPAKPIKRR